MFNIFFLIFSRDGMRIGKNITELLGKTSAFLVMKVALVLHRLLMWLLPFNTNNGGCSAQKDSLGDFLLVKYCQRANPLLKKWDIGQSLTWKHLMMNKFNLEPYTHLQIKSSSYLFWWDDWLGVGLLVNYITEPTRPNNIKLFAFIVIGRWNVNKIIKFLLYS